MWEILIIHVSMRYIVFILTKIVCSGFLVDFFRLRCMGTSPSSTINMKRNNFYGILFASKDNVAILEWGLFLKEITCL